MEYFATLAQDRLLGELKARVDTYYNWILMTNRLARWRVAFNTYYGQRGLHNSSFVSSAGEKGELSFLMSNEYRNLIQHTLVLATQSRVALETVAENTDSVSKSQSYVAKGIIEYFRRDGGIDDNTYCAAEMALIMDHAWVFNEWDVNLGDDGAMDPDTQQVVKNGDIRSRARSPLDVIIDFTKLDPRMHDWRIIRDPMNKFDLAAQHPEQADEITSLTRDLTKDALFRFGDIVNYHTNNQSPDIDVYTFYHKRSPSLPEGRMVQWSDKVCLFDGPIPYRKLPGNRICPAEQILSPLGYSNANDLLGLQDVLDALVSAATTNMTNMGVNNIWTKPSPNFDFQQIAEGMNLIESEEKPEVLIMNRLPPEWMSLTNFIIQRMETYMGSNSVARGNVEGKDLSGAAMALLQSMSIQFNSGFTKSVNRLVEDNGNDIIMLTQDFAEEPRLGMIIGENNRYMMKQYSSKSVSSIQRVYCRQSNPMKDTTAGRLTIVQEASKTNGGLSQAQFAEIIDTGNTDCLLEQDRNAKLAIDQENEAMMAGEVPPVVFIENHPNHIYGHAKIVSSPDDKKDPGLVQRVQAHVNMHLKVWGETDPNILRALNIPPLILPPPPMAPALPPPQVNHMHGPVHVLPPKAGPSHKQLGPPSGPAQMPPPVPPGAQPPMPQGAPNEEFAPNQAPASNVLNLPNQPPNVSGPNFPKNPLTGQRWNPETGGLNQAV